MKPLRTTKLKAHALPVPTVVADNGHNVGEHGGGSHSDSTYHHRHQHLYKKHSHNRYKEELHSAIAHFESAKSEYANTLLYPEICMARVPFITPVPTAIARAVAYYSFSPDFSEENGDCFSWSFIPEAIATPNWPDGVYAPFQWGTGKSTDDENIVGQGTNYMFRDKLFPKMQFDSMCAARIVGASVTVSQTQRLVDRAGYGIVSRIYGLTESNASYVSKASVINATYKDEANYTSPDESLRMIYAPGDFSDLHLRSQDEKVDKGSSETHPIIQGFITGYQAKPGTYDEQPMSVTFEFNVVIEYVPKAKLYQMVERKPAVSSPGALAKGQNLVSKVGAVLNASEIEKMTPLADMTYSDL